MSVRKIRVEVFHRPEGWRLEVLIVSKKQRLIIYGEMNERTERPYSSCSDALVSARHLLREVMPEAPAGVPGVPVDRWNTDGDVKADKLTVNTVTQDSPNISNNGGGR